MKIAQQSKGKDTKDSQSKDTKSKGTKANSSLSKLCKLRNGTSRLPEDLHNCWKFPNYLDKINATNGSMSGLEWRIHNMWRELDLPNLKYDRNF